jgi:hypothetical protein
VRRRAGGTTRGCRLVPEPRGSRTMPSPESGESGPLADSTGEWRAAAPLVNDLLRRGLKSWLLCNNDWGSLSEARPGRALLVEPGTPIGNVGCEEGAAHPHLFHKGMGQGTLSFSKNTQTRI